MMRFGRGSVVAALAAILLVVGVAVQAQVAPPRIAVLARSDNPVDALAASAIAAQFGGAVYLTPRDRLSDDARAGLLEFAPTLVIIAGGPVALAPEVEAAVQALPLATRRVAGENREATARELNKLLAEFDPRWAVADAGPRVQALVVPDTPPSLERAEGVTAVTSPQNGVYCLTLASSAGVDLSKDVVHVGIDWGMSFGDNLRAYSDADDSLDACAAGQLVVQTFGDDVTTNGEVAFTVLIP